MKLFKQFLLFTLIFIVSLTTISCSLYNSANSDREISNKRFEDFLNAVSKKDEDAIRQLFSAEAIEQCVGFDDKANLLFDYFAGDFISYDDMDAYLADDEIEKDGTKRKKISSTYTVKTSKEQYRIAIFDCITDSKDQRKVGFKSLYIVKESESPSHGFAYWGDQKETPGINIGIPDNAQPMDF